jgi:capsular exopolysaccharide synthesis family protein
MTPGHLWGAFRRRWFLAVFLGIAAAVPVVYFAWKYVPAPYLAEAEIQVLTAPPHKMFPFDENINDFRNFKAKQLKEVKHESTLLAVLDHEHIMRLPMIREARRNHPDLVEWLRNELQVESASNEFFTISLSGEDPRSLFEIVTEITNEYLRNTNAELEIGQNSRRLELEKYLGNLGEAIRLEERSIEELTARTNPNQLDLQRESKLAEIVALNSELRSAERELKTFQARLDVMQASEGDERETRTPILSEEELRSRIESDPRYLAVKNHLRRIRRDLENYSNAINSENHPQIIELNMSLKTAASNSEETQANLKQWYLDEAHHLQKSATQKNIAAIQAQIVSLNSYIEVRKRELEDLKLDDWQIGQVSFNARLREESLADDKALAHLLRTEINKLKIEQDSGQRIQIYREATLPRERNTKKKYLLSVGGGFGAFSLMVAMVTFLELRFMRISSLQQLDNEFQFPVLGTIPRFPAKLINNASSSLYGDVYKRVFEESVDSIRTMIIKLQKLNRFKSLMVTSALGGEGKSTVSCQLAVSFARAGRKTLLIDADLRSPSVNELFQIREFPGLCEAIRNEIPVEKCIVPTPIPRLSILPAGELDRVTLRRLAEDRVGELLEELRQNYDIIIFDSAPVLPVTDSLLLLQNVDGIVLSIRRDVTRISKVASTLHKIEGLGGNLLGAVVIGIDGDDYFHHSKKAPNIQDNIKPQTNVFETTVTNGHDS